jgi:hypothetical protein
MRSMKTRYVVVFTLVLLTAVFSATALTANLNGPIGQQAGSFAATIFSMFSSGDDKKSPKQVDPDGGILIKPSDTQRDDAGAINAPALAYSNPAAILVPATGTSGQAGPYPSTISVAGFPGSVQKVTVTLSGFSHTFPDDVDVMLVGPGGQSAVLMSDMGGGGDIVNLTFTFDDAAGAPLADSTQLVSGGYQPGNSGAGDTFPAPAPVSGGSALSAFNGTNPNGVWSLYINDDAGGDVGTIASGWSMEITPAACAAPPANMVAWYPGEVNTNDIIGDPANNGTFQGAGSYTTGVVGNGFNFTGTNNVQVPTSAAINVGAASGISVDAWIRPTNLVQQAIVEWERNNGAGDIGVHFYQSVGTAGNIYLNIVDTANVNHITQTTTGVLTAGANQHVAFTYDKATGAVAIYLNGVAQTLTSSNLGTGFTPGTGGSMFIGRRATGTDFFVGVVDEVEVFSRALTGAEVASINTAGAVGKCHVSQIQFDLSNQSVGEAAGSTTVRLRRIGANDTTANVDFFTADGTAVAPGDYSSVSIPSVTFAPGARFQDVTINITDDAIDEPTETLTANISQVTGTGASLGAPTVNTISILDNDPGAAFTAGNASLVEGNSGTSNMVFTITKTNATAFDETVNYTTVAVSATAGTDYTTTSGTLTFLAGETTKTVNVPIVGDLNIEADETFTFDLTSTSSGGALTDGTGTILDDDSSVQFTSATFTHNPEGTGADTTATLSVSRTSGGGTAIPAASVDASTIQVGGSATGNNSCAIAGTDYVVVSGQTLSWAAGDLANKNLLITICADSRDEPDETLNSQLSNAVNTQIGAQSTTVTTVTDDDAPPSFALTPATNTVAEGASATYTVTRSGNETQNSTTVTWTASSGTASNTADIGSNTGTVTFAAGTGGTQTFTIAASTDGLFEGSENFTVTLTAATNGSAFSGTTTTTITDVDTAPTVAINDVTQVELNSGSSAFIFTITRTGNAQANQTMTASTQDGGGAVAATAPSDYTAIAGDTVTFTQGQTSRQVAVIVNGDVTFEADETFRVNLSNFNFGSATDGTGLGTILNDDAAPVFQFAATAGSPNETVNEGNSGTTPARFTITKTGLTELSSTVTVNTVDGTATAGSDYVALVNAAVATFAPGDTVKTFDVTVNGDTIFENTEAFTVNLSNVTNGTFGTPTTATGTITNDDIAPVLTISSTTPTVTEGGTTVWTYTRSFTSPTTGTALTASAVCTGSVTSGNTTTHAQGDDFSAGGQTISFLPGDPNTKTCNIATSQDTVFEGAETFTVSTGSPTNATTTGGTFTGTINNDDACSFTVSNVSLAEGNSGTTPFNFTVTKGCDTGGNTATFGYSNTDGTAVAPVDYTQILPGTLLYQPAETTKPLTVLVNGDLTVEPDETFNVNAVSAVVNGVPVPNGACGTATCALVSGVGTILNDDGFPISISGTITNFSPAGPLAGVSVSLTGSTTATTTTNAAGAYSFTGLPSGGNFLVTPTMAGKVMSPTTRTYTGITTSQTAANFVAYDTGSIPRTLNVVNAYAVPGSPVTQNITLTAQSDEASLSFSLNYDPAILSSPVVACGTDSGAGCPLTVNTGTPGVIGVSVDPVAATWAAGTRIVITVTYATAATAASNTPVTFGDVPTLRRTSDSGSNPLPTVYNNGFVVFQQGLESDVAARNTGSGAVIADDVIQTRRFTTGLDTPSSAFNEFQRADSAPGATKGDGLLGATDVIQARRYSVGLDPSQTAGGPFVAVPPPAPAPEVSVKGDKGKGETSVGLVWRILNSTGSPGSQVTNCTEIDSQGNEGGYQTSVTFDPTKVSISGVSSPATNPDVTLGTGVAPGSSMTVNGNQANLGRIGFLVDSNVALLLGTRQVVCLRFTILPGTVGPTTVALAFGNVPTPGSMSDLNANNLPYTTEPGQINVLGPTAAGVSVSGRVTTPSGAGLRGATVVITDNEGVRRTATTSTFGYYQFEDIEVGNTYIIGVTSRRYRFAPRTLQVLDSLTDVDFVGQE